MPKSQHFGLKIGLIDIFTRICVLLVDNALFNQAYHRVINDTKRIKLEYETGHASS